MEVAEVGDTTEGTGHLGKLGGWAIGWLGNIAMVLTTIEEQDAALSWDWDIGTGLVDNLIEVALCDVDGIWTILFGDTNLKWRFIIPFPNVN